MFFSPSSKGFYSPDVHAAMPDDAVEISDALYTSLIDGQTSDTTIAIMNGAPALQPIVRTVPQLAATLVAAASAVCADVTGQIVPDDTHRNAYANAAAAAMAAGGPPTVDPIKTAFVAQAAVFGLQPAAFATVALAVAAMSMTLSTALVALEAAAGAAKTPADLASSLTSFEVAIGAVVASLNGAGLVISIVAPSAISIVGVNA